MSEEEKPQSHQKLKDRFWVAESKVSPPPEPVNAVPFSTDPKPLQRGLLSPPVEPVNISPFPAKPVQQTNTNKSSSETTK